MIYDSAWGSLESLTARTDSLPRTEREISPGSDAHLAPILSGRKAAHVKENGTAPGQRKKLFPRRSRRAVMEFLSGRRDIGDLVGGRWCQNTRANKVYRVKLRWRRNYKFAVGPGCVWRCSRRPSLIAPQIYGPTRLFPRLSRRQIIEMPLLVYSNSFTPNLRKRLSVPLYVHSVDSILALTISVCADTEVSFINGGCGGG